MSIQIIGMDLSDLDDFSVISSMCSTCHHIIETKVYKPEINCCMFTIFKECPNCGIRLKRHKIKE